MPLEIEDLEKLGKGADLFGPVGDGLLAQNQPIFDGPGINQELAAA